MQVWPSFIALWCTGADHCFCLVKSIARQGPPGRDKGDRGRDQHSMQAGRGNGGADRGREALRLFSVTPQFGCRAQG